MDTRIRDQLMWKALCALDEAMETTKTGAVPPSFALRFALAYLYALSDGTRWVYDGFWREMQRPTDGHPRCHKGRNLHTWSAMQGIIRSLGINVTTGLGTLDAMRKHNAPEAIACRRIAASIKQEAEVQCDRQDPVNQRHG